jgi:hypothetical protein
LLKILLIAGKSPYLGIAYGLFLNFISIIYVRIAMTTHVLILLIFNFNFNFNLLPHLTVAGYFASKETVLVLLS